MRKYRIKPKEELMLLQDFKATRDYLNNESITTEHHKIANCIHLIVELKYKNLLLELDLNQLNSIRTHLACIISDLFDRERIDVRINKLKRKVYGVSDDNYCF